MRGKILITKIIIYIFTILLVLGINNISYSAIGTLQSSLPQKTGEYEKIVNNREPRIQSKKTDPNYLYIFLHDDAGIQTSKSYFLYQGKRVKLELLENPGIGAYTESKNKIIYAKSYTGKRYDYGIKIKKSDLSTEYNNIFVFSYDTWESCFIKETFKIKKLLGKNSKGEYYAVNHAPRVVIQLIGGFPCFYAKDYSGIKSIKVLNEATRETIYKFDNQSNNNLGANNSNKLKKDEFVNYKGVYYPITVADKINMSLLNKARIGEDLYKVRIIAEDSGGIKNEKTIITHIYEKDKIAENVFTSSISVNPSNVTLILGEKESTQLKAKIFPSNVTNKKIIWTSSNNNIATVNNGKVVAKKEGTVTISAVAKDGSGKKGISTIKVKRKDLKQLSIPKSNNAYMCNLEIRKSLNIADPYVLKANGYYYIYSTGNDGIKLAKTNDFKKITGLPNVNKNNKSKFSAYWAPEVYYYNKKYYLFYTGQNSEKGPKIMVATSNSPEGPFTKDYDIKSKVKNPMDATVLFDGNHIYMYTMSQNNKNIYVEELNSSLTKPISSAKKVLSFDSGANSKSDRKKYWDWNQNEGPFVIKNGSTYYLMYSSGTYKDHTYTIGYATCNSPTGKFTKKTLGTKSANGTASLLHGSFSSNGKYNSDAKIYGTGHNSVLKISDDEMYILYHAIVFKNNKFFTRKIEIDRLGINNGILYVNGPTTEKQPLISGANGYYKLNTTKYSVTVGNKVLNSLKDNMNYNAEKTSTYLEKKGLVSVIKTSTNSVKVSIKENKKISDIWLMSTLNGWNGVTVNAIINNKYIIKNVKFGNTGMGKFQMPNISENIKNIEFTFNKKVNLTEVSVYYKK